VAPYWSVIIVLSTFLQSSNVKPTQVCSAPAGRQVFNNTGGTSKGIMTSILHFENADRELEQKRTSSQFHCIELTHKHYKPTCVGMYLKAYF
jgi:hypothetical protein